MSTPGRLFAYVFAPSEHHDRILLEHIDPLARELARNPLLEAFCFTRSSEPEWLLRVTARGDASWLDASVRPLLEGSLSSLGRTAIVREDDLPEYGSEIERWGGPVGIGLCERIWHHDSLLCLDWLEAESRAVVSRTRREFSLVMTERFLDLLDLDRDARLAFYARGHAWPVERGVWSQDDLETLERKYRALEPGLASLLARDPEPDPETIWGGGEAARIAERGIESMRPAVLALLEARARGSLFADWPTLVWGLAHLHAIRLGIEAVPEAVLRFFVHRFLAERSS